MKQQRLGRQSYAPISPPTVVGYGSVGGKKECEGPLGGRFDHSCKDDKFGEKSWEKAESAMQKLALDAALKRAGLHTADLDFLAAGDLLNQCIGSSFAAREEGVQFLGLYGACSTMGEGLALTALLLSGGYGTHAAVVTSSHFCSAERQYRTPLEYGSQRTPTAQWTATAAGAAVLTSGECKGPKIDCVTIGKIQDKGIRDANNMGAAMAPVSVKLTPCCNAARYALPSTHNSDRKGGASTHSNRTLKIQIFLLTKKPFSHIIIKLSMSIADVLELVDWPA